MPSRAYTSFLQAMEGYKLAERAYVSMPSRAYTSFLRSIYAGTKRIYYIIVSMPSRAYTSFLPESWVLYVLKNGCCVNALSGLYLISTFFVFSKILWHIILCQCPLGLIPHFYSSIDVLSAPANIGVNALSGLYLISTEKNLKLCLEIKD